MCFIAEFLECQSACSPEFMRLSVIPNFYKKAAAPKSGPKVPKRTAMAWRCHGTTNDELVDNLAANKLVKDPRAVEAMRAVDRRLFSRDKEASYQDAPHGIGWNATISAPHMHASCLEILKDHLQPGNAVLDVGSGSGYLTAVMSHMVRQTDGDGSDQVGSPGKVVGIEHILELTEGATKAVEQIPFAKRLLHNGSLLFVTGDGLQGYPDGAPYDAIHVGACAAQIPQNLIDQLAPGGRMVLPVGRTGSFQELTVVDKDPEGKWQEKTLFGVAYVPLTSRQAQLGLNN